MIANLEEALNNVPNADSASSRPQQLLNALAYWQGIQTTPSTADQGANFDTAADDAGGSTAAADAVQAIALIQAELARIGD